MSNTNITPMTLVAADAKHNEAIPRSMPGQKPSHITLKAVTDKESCRKCLKFFSNLFRLLHTVNAWSPTRAKLPALASFVLH